MERLDEETLLAHLRGEPLETLDWMGVPREFVRFLAILDSLQSAAADQAPQNLALWLDDKQRAWLQQLAEMANRLDDAAINQSINTETYAAQKEPRFGESNPERMDLAFWHFMVRRRWTAWSARMQYDRACQEYMRQLDANPPPAYDDLQKMSAEEQAAMAANLPRYKYGGAVWCFTRFGQSQTFLPDGSQVLIGGEHEDWYDPDFHIYNDVVVIRPNLEIEIYGYPRQVFRPTDFHTATLVDYKAIYIIGCLGYWGTQPLGETPVYRLNCKTFQMELLATNGEAPGWIYKHRATYVAERNAIRITGGTVLLRFEGKRRRRENRKTYWLDLATNTWSSGRSPSELP